MVKKDMTQQKDQGNQRGEHPKKSDELSILVARLRYLYAKHDATESEYINGAFFEKDIVLWTPPIKSALHPLRDADSQVMECVFVCYVDANKERAILSVLGGLIEASVHDLYHEMSEVVPYLPENQPTG